MPVTLRELPIPDDPQVRATVDKLREHLRFESVTVWGGDVLVWNYGRVAIPAQVFRAAYMEVPDGQPEGPPDVTVKVLTVMVTCSSCGSPHTGPVTGHYPGLDRRDIKRGIEQGKQLRCKCGAWTPIPAEVLEMFGS